MPETQKADWCLLFLMRSLAAPLTFTHMPLPRGCPMSGVVLDMIGVNEAPVTSHLTDPLSEAAGVGMEPAKWWSPGVANLDRIKKEAHPSHDFL